MDESHFSQPYVSPSPLAPLVPPGPIPAFVRPPEQSGGGPLSDRVLLAILDSLADGVVVADNDGRFLLFNKAAARILRTGALDLPPTEWPAAYGCYREDGLTPYDGADLPLIRAIRGEALHDVPLLIRNPQVPDGVWLSINSSPLRDESGTICGGVIVFRDVTARRRAQEREQLLSAAVEQTGDFVLITDRESVIEYANPAAEAISGYSRDELIGSTPRILRSGLHTREFYAEMWAALLRGETYRGTIVNRKKCGETFHSQQTITPIRDRTGAVSRFVSVGKDITELRRTAERDGKLQLAKVVQQRLLPEAPSRDCGLEIAAGAVMAYETGGDFYDFIRLPDGRMGVAVGDVSGHAFDAALVMARSHAHLRSIARSRHDPGEILTLANQDIIDDVLDSQFVTALLVAFDPVSRRLSYSNAGHPSGYVLDREGRVTRALDSVGVPLGLFRETSLPTIEVGEVAAGSLILLLTDGVFDTEDAEGHEFGAERALEVVRGCLNEPTEAIVGHLQKAVGAFSGNGAPTDDITIVACRVR